MKELFENQGRPATAEEIKQAKRKGGRQAGWRENDILKRFTCAYITMCTPEHKTIKFYAPEEETPDRFISCEYDFITNLWVG